VGEVTTIGLDITKSVFQVHGIDSEGQVVIRQRLTRARVLPFFAKLPRCRIGIEACATSYHWARELRGLGHDVRLMPPAYVKPYVKRQKNDAADAEVICEAVQRPSMRFVEPKTVEQQSVMMLHRARLMLTRQHSAGQCHPRAPGGTWFGSADRPQEACSPACDHRRLAIIVCQPTPAVAFRCWRRSCS
jgi:transposase